MKAMLIKFAMWIIGKYGASTMAGIERTIVEKTAKHEHYKDVCSIYLAVSRLAEGFGEAAKDGEFSDDEYTSRVNSWQAVIDDLIDVAAEVKAE